LRVYLSNIRPHWPIERQEAALDKVLPGWRRGSVYRDELPPRKRKAHGPDDLTSRATLLRPSSRRGADEVYVATPAVLAWTLSDFLAVLGGLSAKSMTLTMLDSEMAVAPDAGPAEVAKAAKAFEAACRRQKGEPGERGGDVSGRVRSEAAKARAAQMRPYWGLPSKEYPTRYLLEIYDLSRPTAILYCGKRADAQREHRKGLKIAESNRRRAGDADE